MDRKSAWFDHIYDANELQFYQDFETSHHNAIEGEINMMQVVRYCLLAIDLGVLLLTLIAMEPKNLLIYFTNWTMLLSIASQYLIIRAVDDKDFHKSLQKMALNHFLYSLTIIMNIITVSVYWTVIHTKNMKDLEGKQLATFQQYVVHLVPAFCCWVNAFFTNIVLSRKVLLPLV